jgi:hypothetical protein
MADTLELFAAVFCPHPARPWLPSNVSGHTAVFTNAPFPPIPEWTADRMMIGTFMPDCDPAIIRVAEAVKNTGSVTDWL